MAVKETGISHAIIVDGAVKPRELSAAGRTERWLHGVLASRGIKSEDVFLLAVDDGDEVICIPKEKSLYNKKKGRKQ